MTNPLLDILAAVMALYSRADDQTATGWGIDAANVVDAYDRFPTTLEALSDLTPSLESVGIEVTIKDGAFIVRYGDQTHHLDTEDAAIRCTLALHLAANT